jgi:hypothetical protein
MVAQADLKDCCEPRGDLLDVRVLPGAIGELRHRLGPPVDPRGGKQGEARGGGKRPLRPPGAERLRLSGLDTPDQHDHDHRK